MKIVGHSLLLLFLLNLTQSPGAFADQRIANQRQILYRVVREYSAAPTFSSYLQSLEGQVDSELLNFVKSKIKGQEHKVPPKMSLNNGMILVHTNAHGDGIPLRIESSEQQKFLINNCLVG